MKIETLKFIIYTHSLLSLISLPHHSNAQQYPSVENNCFQYFDPSAAGRNDVNAYLLSYISWLIYPERLCENTGLGADPEEGCATELQNDSAAFVKEFRNRFEHMFWNSIPPSAPKAPEATWTTIDAPSDQIDPAPLACQLSVSYAQQIGFSSIANQDKVPKTLKQKNLSQILVSPVCRSQWNNAVEKYDLEYAKYLKYYQIYSTNYENWIATKPYIKFYSHTLTQNHLLQIPLSNINEKIGFSWDPEAILISTPKFIIIAFRGTDRVKSNENDFTYQFGEWIGTNFFIPTMESPDMAGKFHSGMLISLNLIKNDLIKDLEIYNHDKSKPVWFTGHSLGAGQAAMFTLLNKDQESMRYNTHTLIFAAPRFIGDATVATHLNAPYIPSYSVPQRYEWRDDAITWVGSLGGLVGAAMDPIIAYYNYTVYGDRIWISDEGAGHMNYHCAERSSSGIPNLCDHNPEWYVRATYDYLSTSEKIELPANAFRPGGEHLTSAACNFEGSYYIRAVGCTNKYLEVGGGLGLFCNSLRLGSIDNPADNIFVIEPILTIFNDGSYTIKSDSIENRFIDVDYWESNNEGAEINTCARSINFADRTHQEWYVGYLEDGRYLLTSVKTGNALQIINCNNLSMYDQDIANQQQMWELIRIE